MNPAPSALRATARSRPATLWLALGALALGVFCLLGCGTPYYELCDEESHCPASYVCADPATLRVCTTLCTTTAECRDRHGERSFCARAGVCLSTCASSDECPSTAYCDVTSTTCLR